MEKSIFCVYLHRRLDDNIVFYVGRGNKKRPNSKYNRNKYWHSTVAKHGYTVEIVASELTKKESGDLEIELIKKYRGISGVKLTNLTNGGEAGMSGYTHTPESRLKISKLKTGVKKSEETIQKLKESLMGRIPSTDTKEKISKSLKGHTHTIETKAKMSLANRGRKATDVAKLNLSRSMLGKNKGKVRSQDSIEKNRQAHLGKRLSPETIAKREATKRERKEQGLYKPFKPSAKQIEAVRQSHLGKKLSPESIAKREATKKLNREKPEYIKPTITEEQKEKLREINTGKKDSEATREKKRLAMIGNTFNLGRKASDETKLRMSMAQKERAQTEEARERTRKLHLGRKQSEEHIAKRVAAIKITKENKKLSVQSQ